MTLQFREYQKDIAERAAYKIIEQGMVYLAMQVRTGKTLTALLTCELLEKKSVLFITKKKAISSVQYDYALMTPAFSIEVINYESLHKVEGNFDIVICDEHHRNGAFPKPNVSAVEIKKRWAHLPQIYLSGTPTPESFSQFYHQFWVSNFSPFAQYKTFYKWAKDFVNITKKNFGYGDVSDYSQADEQKINRFLEGYIIDFTQEEAGFKSKVTEKVIEVEMIPFTYAIAKDLATHGIYRGKTETILADTAVKQQSKIQQVFSGTCIGESGNAIIFDLTKAEYIANNFPKKRLGIFYKFKAELDALKQVLGYKLTTELDAFNMEGFQYIALQIQAGREGISLRQADYLVYYNIDHSAVSYWQSRDRLTTKERTENTVFWLFAKGGIESKIYNQVMKKKNYTLTHFKNDFGTKNTKQNNQTIREARLVRAENLQS
jgi:hypothetical protein